MATTKDKAEEIKEPKKPKAKAASKKAPEPGVTDRIGDFFSDERLPKVIGLTCILVAMFLAVALLSYIFTWQHDQADAFQFTWRHFFGFKSDIPYTELPHNMMGRMGAIISHQLVYRAIGLASFVLVPLFLFTGLKLAFKVDFVSLWKVYRYSFLSIIWVSITLGLIHNLLEVGFPLGGAFGSVTAEWLRQFAGIFGAIALISFAMLVFAVIEYNLNLAAIKAARFSKGPNLVMGKNSKVGPDGKLIFDDESDVKDWTEKIKKENIG